MSRVELAILFVTALLLMGSGWIIRGWHDNAALAAQAEALTAKIEQIQKQAQADSADYEKQRAQASQTIAKLNKTMEKYRAKNVIPADCFIPADGMLAIASAVKAGSAR